MKLEVIDGYIQFNGGSIQAMCPVLDAIEIGGKIIVIYDYMQFPRGKASRNMFAYEKSGEEFWRAEDIGMGGTDAYTSILFPLPLIVGNFAGFNVCIDFRTGKVKHKEFTK